MYASGVATDADALALHVAAEGGGSYEASMTLAGAQHVVESVPAGRVEVRVEAWRAGTLIQSGAVLLQMVDGAIIPVTVALHSGGVVEPVVVSAPLTIPIGPLRESDVSGGILAGSGVVPAADIRTFVGQVEAALGSASEDARLASARLVVDRAASHEVEKLQDLWRDELDLYASAGDTPVQVASASLGEDTASVELGVVQGVEVPEGLESAHQLTVTVSGEARRTFEEEVRGQLNLVITLSAGQ